MAVLAEPQCPDMDSSSFQMVERSGLLNKPDAVAVESKQSSERGLVGSRGMFRGIVRD
jgi:hypothetical protein